MLAFGLLSLFPVVTSEVLLYCGVEYLATLVLAQVF